jgi:hypothetical protein
MNERTLARVAALAGDLRTVRLRQPVDTERLVPRRPPSATPRRALLLGNTLTGATLRLIVDTWGAEGVEVVQVGTLTDKSLHPEDEIAAADIVVGKGRAILDAMSCGRPAYVYDAWGGDGWVTEETFEAIEANSIAGQAFPDVVDAARLRADLAAYDADMGRANRLRVTSRNGARAHAQALVGLAREVTGTPSAEVGEASELARLTRLCWRAEVEVLRLQTAVRTEAERHAAEAERYAADLQSERALRVDAERRRGRARARSRVLKRRHDALVRTRWFRLGRGLRVVKPVRPARGPDRGRVR